jgi:hypothetical protein
MKVSPRSGISHDEEKDMVMSTPSFHKTHRPSSFISTGPNTPLVTQLPSEKRPVTQARILNDFFCKKDQAVDEEAQIC